MRRVAALVLALTLPGVARGQVDEVERYELYTECRPLFSVTSVFMSENNRDAMEDAMTAAAEASVESRLRAAGLWWPERRSSESVFLHPTVTVEPMLVPSGLKLYDYQVRLALNKQLLDEFGNREPGTEATWVKVIRPGVNSSGVHNFPRTEQDLLNAVSSALGRLMDQFLAAYLRVNASACQAGRSSPP